MRFHLFPWLKGTGIGRLAVAAMMAVALAGCVSEDVAVTRALTSISTGADTNAVAWAYDLATDSHYSRTLGMVELGRVRMLRGDFEGGLRAFNAASDTAMDRNERQPVIKLGDVGNTVMAATVTDDRTRQYYLPPYELNLVLNYTILTDLFLGRHEDAMVDARRAVYAQDHLADTYGPDVAEAAKADKGKASAAAGQASTNMLEVLERTRNSWENAALWWLTGLMFESDRDASNAAISYRKAYELAPGNPFIAADFRRAGAARPASAASVVVVYDEAFVSRRQAVKVVLPIYTAVDIDIPVYRDPPYSPSRVQVAGAASGRMAPALDIQALAYRDLREKMPGIITRAVTRATGQVAAQYGANVIAKNQSNEGAGLAIALGAVAANAVVSALRGADVRTWTTLPMATQIFRGPVTPGKGTLNLVANGRTLPVPLEVAPGETRLVYIADVGGSCRVATASLIGKGAPPRFLSLPSLLGLRAR